jgi:putative spermidine/putrescine transport system ATP-binding protein
VPEPAVHLDGISKTFGDTVAVDRVDLVVQHGEFLTLLGPSGCGKTTTLNLIAGFHTPDAGAISLAGRPVNDLPPFRRDIGLVFQDYALFPHMSVAQNIAFGLRMRRIDRREITRRVAEALELVRLAGLAERRPTELSGGQRQRVALARALVIRPTVLLLDEPLSNLDLKLREDMRLEITALQRQLAITTILVTHDQSEALVVSDRIAVMNRGRIEQVGRPTEIYERPASRFVAEFIGTMNFVTGHAVGNASAGRLCAVRTDYGELTAPAPREVRAGQQVLIAFRPERCRLAVATQPQAAAFLAVPGQVSQHVYLGTRTELHLALQAGGRCVVELSNDGEQTPPAVGDEVRILLKGQDCSVFPNA